MNGRLRYREINTDRLKGPRPRQPFLDVCLFNNYRSDVSPLISPIEQTLTEADFFYRVTLLDLAGFSADGKRFAAFIRQFPRVKIFLPVSSSSMEEAINLYVRESKANFVLMLSGDAIDLTLDMRSVVKTFYSSSNVLGVVPNIRSGDQPLKTHYKIRNFNRNLFLSYEEYGVSRFSIMPYKFNILFDRDKFLAVEGMDESWGEFFMANLDFGYRLYANSHTLCTTEGFEVIYPQGNDADYYNLKKKYPSLAFSLKCFQLKNIRSIRPLSIWLGLLSLSLLRLDFSMVKRLFDWFWKRRFLERWVVSDQTIEKRLAEN